MRLFALLVEQPARISNPLRAITEITKAARARTRAPRRALRLRPHCELEKVVEPEFGEPKRCSWLGKTVYQNSIANRMRERNIMIPRE
jgi:hypothetical protein